MQKRFLSILLCLTMLSGFVPTGTFAENAGNISSSVSSDASHGGEKTSEDNALPGGEVLSDGEQTPNSENLSDGENSLNEEISLDDEKSSNGEKSSNENLSDGKNPSGKDEAEEIKDKSYGEEKTSLSDDEISLSAVSDSKTETSIAEVTIGENVKYYDDIKEAFDAVQATSNKSTVKLLGDVNIGTGNIVLIKNGDITFDLNGFSLSGSFAAGENFGDGMLSIGASGENPALTFTLDDSSARKSGTIENECSDENTSVIRVCSTKAVLNVAGGTVKRTGNDGISMDAAAVSAVYGNANIYGGKIEGNVYGITAASGLKSVKVYGDADVYGYYAAINSLAYNDSNVELSGGTFSSFANRPVFITQKGTIGSLLAQGYTFTDKNGVKIDSETSSASFFETVSVVENLMPVEYIDENGNDAQCAEYIALMGDPEDGKLDGSSGEAWYVISGDLRATMNWTVTGTVNLILTDSANCVIPVYCIKFEDDSLLRIYGQKNGTGDLAVVSTDKETAALGGPATKSYDPKYGITGDWALGSLEIYGGKIYAESTKYHAAFLRYLTVKGGTFVAQAPENITTVSLRYSDNSLTLAKGYKIAEDEFPQRRALYNNTAGIRIIITKCTEHIWNYSSSQTEGMHKVICDLCSESKEEAHAFNLYGGTNDETSHTLKCACGEISNDTQNHIMKTLPNDDTLTHGYACEICGYRNTADDKVHDFSADDSKCSECGFERVASVKSDSNEFNCATLNEAIEKAAAAGNNGSVITLHADCGQDELGAEALKIYYGTFTFDFNGYKIEYQSGRTLLTIEKDAKITLKNGTIRITGVSTLNDQAAVCVNSGCLTLEDFTIHAGGNSLVERLAQFPAVKFVNPVGLSGYGIFKMTGNVVLGGGLWADKNVRISPVTGGRFICSNEERKANTYTINLEERNICDILKEGYALAKADDANTLVPMYDENGVAISQIKADVQVVAHDHDLSSGKCGCGYVCDHKNIGENGKCTVCDAQIMSVKVFWKDGETDNNEFLKNTDDALKKVKSLNGDGKTDVTVTLLTDLESDWVIADGGKFNLTTANGVKLSQNITVDGKTDITVIGGTYGKSPNGQFKFIFQNGGKVTLIGGGFYDLDVIETGSIYSPSISSIMADGYAFYMRDEEGNESLTDFGNTSSFSLNGGPEIAVIKPHTKHIFKQRTDYGIAYYACDCGLEAVASITTDENTVYYSDFEDAVNAANDGDTIVLCGLYSNSIQPKNDIVFAKGDWRNPIVIDLNGKDISFTERDGKTPNGHKLIIKDNAAVTIKGSGEITSMYAERYSSVTLYGGTYGKLEKDGGDGSGVLSLCKTGYGLKGTNGWVTDYLKDVATDVTVKYAPYEIKDIIVTTDPNGTEDSSVIYTGQKIYIKAKIELENGEEAISESNPVECSISSVLANGGLPAYAFEKQYSSDIVAQKAPLDKSGEYIVYFRVRHLGCVIDNNTKRFTVSVCSHDSYTNGKCDKCGAECAHENVSDAGHCDTCNTDFALSLTNTNGTKSYYTDAVAALSDAILEKNKGCTLKLFKDVKDTVVFNSKHEEKSDRTAFTFDLNGYDFGDSHTDIYLSNVDMTLKTSAARRQWTTFYVNVHLYKNASLTCPDVVENTTLLIDYVMFTYLKGTNTVSLGEGIYLNNFIRPNDGMTLGEILKEGCVFQKYDGTLLARNDGTTVSIGGTVVKCPHDMENSECKYCGYTCSHSNVTESGYCADCNTQFNLMLTLGENTSLYRDIYSAFDEAQKPENNGCTVKLINDITLSEKNAEISGGNFTFDLNGKQVTDTISETIKLSSGKMTLKSETQGMIIMQISIFNDAQLVVSDGFKADSIIYQIAIGDNSTSEQPLIVDSDNVRINNLYLYKDVKLALSKGTYGTIIATDIKTSGEKLLAEGYVFANKETGEPVSNYTEFESSAEIGFFDLIIVQCTHKEFENGKCKYCGFVCSHPKYTDGKCAACGIACLHTNVDETTYKCGTCDMQMVIKTEKKSGAIIYGTNISDAMNASEGGEIFTLLEDALFGKDDVYIYDNNKTVTLDLNGHSVIKQYDMDNFVMGGTASDKAGKTGKLIVKGKGDIEPGFVVYDSGVLDFSDWTGAEINRLSLYENSLVTGIHDKAHINSIWFNNLTTADIQRISLDGGSYGSIIWNNFNGLELQLGNLLAPGYAFQRESDNSFVSYTDKLYSGAMTISDVKVVKCTNHADDSGDGSCDYCNAELAASINGVIYTNLQDAIETLYINPDINAKIILLRDANDSYTISEGQSRINLNGHTIKSLLVTGSTGLAPQGTDGTIQNLTFNGTEARFVSTSLPVMGQINVSGGATWSSILPDSTDYQTSGNRYGYKAYSDPADKKSFKWYDRNTIKDYAGNNTYINNVSIEPLPIMGKYTLMLGGVPLENGRVVNSYGNLKFSLMLGTGDVECTVYYKRIGDDVVKSEPLTIYKSERYESEFTTNFGVVGEYEVWAEMTKDGYKCQTEKYTIKAKKNLANAEITLDNDEFTYAYPGVKHNVNIASVTISNKSATQTVPADVYDVSGELEGTDAKTYTVTITAKEDSDYTGSATVTWKILPCVLTEVVACDYIKNYDGTTDVTADNIGKNDLLPHFRYDGGPVSGIVLGYGTDYNITAVNANFLNPDAESHCDVSFTVELTNSNYTFKDENNNNTNTKTVTQSMNIGKAHGLPAGCEPENGGLIVRNNAAHTYEYDVSKLLKDLPSGLSYGTKKFRISDVNILDGGYIDDGTVQISEDGILTVPVKKVLTIESNSEIAIVTLKVAAQNYIDFNITVMVYARSQIEPTGNPKLGNNGTIAYGEKISKISLSGSMKGVDDEVVKGEFAWKNPNETPLRLGDYEAEWTFTPNGDNAYMYAPTTGKATIKVEKASIPAEAKITAPVPTDKLVYKYDDDTPQVLHTAGSVENGYGTMKYTLGAPESADTVWSETPVTAIDAGDYTVYYKVFGSENYKDSDYGQITCHIEKYELYYKVACKERTYDGTTNAEFESIKFYPYSTSDEEVILSADDYEVKNLKYNSPDAGSGYGKGQVYATGDVALKDTYATRNYKLYDYGIIYGFIKPAAFPDADKFRNNYTIEIRYNDTAEKPLMPTDLGAQNNTEYLITSDGLLDAGTDDGMQSVVKVYGGYPGVKYYLKNQLTKDYINKKAVHNVRIESPDHNYCSDPDGEETITVTIVIVDKATPVLSIDDDSISKVYDGNEISADSIGTATVNGKEVSGTWKWEGGISPVNVSDSKEYTVEFTPDDGEACHTAKKENVNVTISPRNIGGITKISLENDKFTYNGAEQKAKVVAELNGTGLVEGTDYTLEYLPSDDITNVGDKTVKITGIGNFGGTKEFKYTIGTKAIDPYADIAGQSKSFTYTGSPITPDVFVKDGEKELVKDVDFTAEYQNNENAGTATVKLVGIGNYRFEKKITFEITKASAHFTVNPTAKTGLVYNSTEQLLITEGIANAGTIEYRLGENGNWQTAVPKAENAGEYTVYYRIIGDNNHYGTSESSIKANIGQKDIAKNAVVTLDESLTYNRSEQTQSVKSVTSDGLNVTYTVSDNTAKNAGDYTLKITAYGNFKGEITQKFTVAKKQVAASVTVNGTYVYNANEIKPTDVVVKDGDDVIEKSEYTLSYENNINAGTATVNVVNENGGNYVVNGTANFTIDKAVIDVKPKDTEKVYGNTVSFELESKNSLITPSELSYFTEQAIFKCEGAGKYAPVTEYEISVLSLLKNETPNLILNVSGTGKLTVKKAPLKITVNDVSRIYGEPNPELSVSYEGFVEGEDETSLSGTLKLSYHSSIDEKAPVKKHLSVTFAEGLTSQNYEITYISGNVTITKVPVNVSEGISRYTHLRIVFDKALENLTASNFKVKDSKDNDVTITSVTAEPDNTAYLLNGKLTVGEEYKVTVNLSGADVDATHEILNSEVKAIPVRQSTGSSGGSGSEKSFNVTFETNGGSSIASVKVAKNEKISAPAMPEKEGFDFDGWYKDKGLTEKYDFSEKVTSDFTLYAKWNKKDETKPDDGKQDGNNQGKDDGKTDNPGENDWNNPFDDVKKDDWFYNDVKYAYENGLMNGATSNIFEPDSPLDRAMLVTILWRAEGKPQVNYAMTFNDVDYGSYYAEAVRWASSEKIVSGTSDETFEPGKNIKREEIAAILYRYAKYKNIDTKEDENTNILSYDDSESVSEYAISAMQYAVGAGIITGKTSSTLNPMDNALRSEAAAMLHRFFNLIK